MTCTKLEKLEMLIEYAKSIGLDPTEILWDKDNSDSAIKNYPDVHIDCSCEGITKITHSVKLSVWVKCFLYIALRFIGEGDEAHETEAFDTKEEAEAWIKEGKEQQ